MAESAKIQVVSVKGDVGTLEQDGQIFTELKAGDVISPQSLVVTGADSLLVVNIAGQELVVPADQQMRFGEASIASDGMSLDEHQLTTAAVDEAIDAIAVQQGDAPQEVSDFLAALEGEGDILDSLEATAAGPGNNLSGGDSSFVSLTRIAETLSPGQVQINDTAEPGALGTLGATNDGALSEQGIADLQPQISVTVNQTGLVNTNAPVISGLSEGLAGQPATVTITDSNGDIQVIETIVPADGVWELTPQNPLPDGEFTVDIVVTDPDGNPVQANGSGVIDTTAPVISIDEPAVSEDGQPEITGNVEGVIAGTPVTVLVTDAEGNQQTLSTVTDADGNWVATVPNALADGTYDISVSVTDEAGNTGTGEEQGFVGSNIDLSLSIAEIATSNDTTPVISGQSNAPVGTLVQLTVTDQNGITQNLTAQIDEQGNWQVEVPAELAEGVFDVFAEVGFGSSSATAAQSGVIDITAPALSIDPINALNDSTPVVSGSSDLPAGTVVDVIIRDSNGDEQSLQAQVDVNGRWSVEVSEPLSEGNFDVIANAQDEAGNTTRATESGTIDTIAPDITLDSIGTTNDTTPIISGSTSEPAGSIVTITVTDAAGTEQSFTAVVSEDGTWAAESPVELVEGEFFITASVTDMAGNQAEVSDSGIMNPDGASLQIEIPGITNNISPVISGTTTAPQGSIVTIKVTDAEGQETEFLVAVQADGTWSGAVPAELAEGPFQVDAQVEVNGVVTTDTANGEIDLTFPHLTIDEIPAGADTTPTISGTVDLEAGSEVSLQVTDSEGVVQNFTAVVLNDGTWNIAVPSELAEGEFEVLAVAADPAGNQVSVRTTSAVDFNVLQLSIDPIDPTNDSTPLISGGSALAEGSEVSVSVIDSDGNTQVLVAVVDAEGNWSVEPPLPLSEGEFTVEVSATDEAGNEGSVSETGITDYTGPVIAINPSDISADNTPLISGTSDQEPGNTLTVTVTDNAGNSTDYTATVDDSGNWSVETTEPLADGDFTVVAVAVDEAGNVGSATESGAIDTSLGSLAIDAIPVSNDTSPVISGDSSLAEGTLVTVTVTQGASTWSVDVAVAADGTWTTVEGDINGLVEGSFAVDAQAVAPGGNTLSASTTSSIDLTAPVIEIDPITPTNDSTPLISGTSDLNEGDIITVTFTDSVGNSQTVSAEVAADGTWSAVPSVPLSEGEFDVIASATDMAGNETTAGATGMTDYTNPDIVINPIGTTADNTPIISGTSDLAEGSTVTVSVTDSLGNSTDYTATVVAGGNWSVEATTPVANGDITVDASGFDAAGNEGTATATGTVNSSLDSLTIDAIPVSNDTSPVISGDTSLAPGTQVTVTVTQGAASWVVDVLVAADGSWTTAEGDIIGLVEGSFTVDAQALDPAGNTLNASANGSIDLTAPVIEINPIDPSSSSTPAISGNSDLAEGETITVTFTDSAGNTQTVQTTVAADGSWTVTPGVPLAEGDFDVVATAADAAGNESSATATGTTDYTGPEIIINPIGSTGDNTPLISGTSDQAEGSTVSLTVTDSSGNSTNYTATVDAGGNWSVEATTPLANGDVTVEASGLDELGNVGTASATGTINSTLDSLTIDAIPVSNDTSPVISGDTSLDPGTQVTVTVTQGASTWTVNVTVAADGSWTTVEGDITGLVEGSFTATAQAVDTLGNTLSASTNGSIDLTPPIIIIDPIPVDNEALPQITGRSNLSEGTDVEVTFVDASGATHTVSTQVEANGDWTVTPSQPLAEGNYTVTATGTDAAGNTGSDTETSSTDYTGPWLEIDPLVTLLGQAVAITGHSDLPEGSTVTVELLLVDGSVVTAGNATTDANGDWSLVGLGISLLTLSGVQATAYDEYGNLGSDTLAWNDNTPPALTLDLITVTNDSTPLISGTTDVAAGETVSITITDQLGNEIGASATVQPDGTWSVSAPIALAEGTYTVSASVTDDAGLLTTVSDTAITDYSAPALTIDPIGTSTDNTPVISGTSDQASGSSVTVEVTDSLGNSTSYTATVDGSGNWSIEATTALANGAVTVNASATDAAGNTGTTSATGTIDSTLDSLNLDALPVTNDTSPVISGTTSLAPGSQVTVTVTQGVSTWNVNTTVAADGTWSTSEGDITGLAEGAFDIAASATDPLGNVLEANGSGLIDLTPPAVAIDPIGLGNDATPVITGTTDLPAGSNISVAYTDSLGNPQTIVTTVDAGGTWSVELNPGVAEGLYSVTATATDAAGNTATDTASGELDITAPGLTADYIVDSILIVELGISGFEGTATGVPAGTDVHIYGSIDVLGVGLFTVDEIVQTDAAGNWQLTGLSIGAGVAVADINLDDMRFTVSDPAGNTTTVDINDNIVLLPATGDEPVAMSADENAVSLFTDTLDIGNLVSGSDSTDQAVASSDLQLNDLFWSDGDSGVLQQFETDSLSTVNIASPDATDIASTDLQYSSELDLTKQLNDGQGKLDV